MDFIDLYCERTEPGLWNEPLNAISNLAFVLAAWLCWRRYARVEGALDSSGSFLMALVGVIGIGSGLFHTFATYWSKLADVIPIAVFIHAFLLFALKRFFCLSWGGAAGLTAAYAAASTLIAGYAGETALNGSTGYIPPMAVLFAMGWVLRAQGRAHGRELMAAAGVFALSLSLRTVDQAACAYVPFGTHFLWHVFNGVALYLAGRAYMLSAPGISSSAART